MMSVEQPVKWLAGETEVVGEFATLSATNPTYIDLGSSAGIRKPETNSQSRGTVYKELQTWELHI
jgi:hypothetical protein